MENTVGYFYNLHVNIQSFLYCIATVKKYSPGSPIHLYGDESLVMLDDYKAMARMMGLNIMLRPTKCSFINRKDPFETNYIKIQEFFNRMYTACKMMDVKWVIRLEDDVHMRRPISEFPVTTAAGNHIDFGMGGGSIFDRETFIRIYEEDGISCIRKKCEIDSKMTWAGDGLLRSLFEEHGCKYSQWCEITEDWDESNTNKETAAFHHGDKSLYDKVYLKERGII